MIVGVIGFLVASAGAGCGVQAVETGVVRDSSLEALYREGHTWAQFLDAAEARKALWHENWERASVPADVLERARAVPGGWRLLAVAIDGCSDSVSTIPFIAKLVEQVSGLDLRIIDTTAGRALMEAHRSPDGRAATPTLILIDSHGSEAGWWVERPAPLQAWYLENPDRLSTRDLVAQKMEWYHDDAGATTLREIVAILESAAARR